MAAVLAKWDVISNRVIPPPEPPAPVARCGLAAVLAKWDVISNRLADTKRKRRRQTLS